MAKITLNEPGSFIGFNINILPELTASSQTRTSFRLFTDEFPDSALLFYGEDFTFSSSGKPTGGIVTRLHILIDGKITSTFDDISIPFATLLSQAENRQGQLTLEALLGGDDEISGSAGVDYLIGLSGDDVMIGGGGHDQLDGGAGVDTAVYNSFRTQATVSTRGSSVTTTSPEGTDRLDAFEVLSFVDGRLVYEVTDRAAVVYRLYAAALDRAPDPLGFNGWITALERGTTTESMAGFFAGSPEFLDTYGALTDRGFVEQLYRNVLDREGDAEGVAFWTGRLDAGTLNRGQVLAGFSESPEHVERLRAPVEAGLWDANEAASSAARLYHAALDRAPDADGLRYWTGQIAAGLPVAQAADGFAGSPEFQGRYGALDDDGYVRQLYRNVLDREADPEGLAFWAGEIASGRRDRGDVLAGFSESFEFQIKTLPVTDGGILLA